MGGGSPGTHSTQYEKERLGVDKRAYGAVSKTGFQTAKQYEAASQFVSSFDPQSQGQDEAITRAGLKYDPTYGRFSLAASGVDFEAARTDWQTYSSEQQEIEAYKAKEERRKKAPGELTGTSGKVDYTLAIDSDNKEPVVGATLGVDTIDTTPTTASTSQSLGIY